MIIAIIIAHLDLHDWRGVYSLQDKLSDPVTLPDCREQGKQCMRRKLVIRFCLQFTVPVNWEQKAILMRYLERKKRIPLKSVFARLKSTTPMLPR